MFSYVLLKKIRGIFVLFFYFFFEENCQYFFFFFCTQDIWKFSVLLTNNVFGFAQLCPVMLNILNFRNLILPFSFMAKQSCQNGKEYRAQIRLPLWELGLLCYCSHYSRYINYLFLCAESSKFLQVLKLLWKFKVLHNEYLQRGFTEKDFNPPVLSAG